MAACHGHAECVDLLIPVSDPKNGNSWALRHAAENGHAECVKLLIPVSDPKSENSGPLYLAARHGHANCVKLLLPVSDPSANDSGALSEAVKAGRAECVRILIPVSDPLIEMAGELARIASDCEASINALPIILAHEPRLLDELNLQAILVVATANGHDKMTRFISALIEQKAIASHLPRLTDRNALALAAFELQFNPQRL